MPVLTLATTGQTKRTLIDLAYSLLGIAGFEFELSAPELQTALKMLDLMMAEHPFNLMGYDPGQHLPDDVSGIADQDATAVYGKLAERIASSKGKSLAGSTAMATIASAYASACSRYATVPKALIAPNTPRGSGNRWSRRTPFITETE